MPRFVAVHLMNAANTAAFRALPKSEQAATDERGLAAWKAWDEQHAAHIVQPDIMVGKAKRVTASGIADATNDICGFLVVEAESHEAAARLFQSHPHFSIFPGDAIEVMPVVSPEE